MGIHGVENNPATGEPQISGSPRVGLTLSADTRTIMDPDGLEDVTFSYQWTRVDEDGLTPTQP